MSTVVHAKGFLGAFVRPDMSQKHSYKTFVSYLLHHTPEQFRGTELTPYLKNYLSTDAQMTGNLAGIANTLRGSKSTGGGYAIFVSRLEHDVIPVHLLSGENGYKVRVYVVLVLDMFVDKAAYSMTHRLESVYTVATSDGWSYPNNALFSSSPTQAQINQMYSNSLNASLRRLSSMVARDNTVNSRVRATRVFQVMPVAISGVAAPFMATIDDEDTLDADGNAFEFLSQELAYLLHEKIVDEINTRNGVKIAILPPESNWAVGPIATTLANRLANDHKLIVGARESGGSALTIQAVVEKAAVLDGKKYSIGKQQLAASRVSAVIQRVGRNGQITTRPISMKAQDRLAMGQGAGRYIKLDGVSAPPVRGMWREGYLDALDKLTPALVDRMIQTYKELGQ